jgi:hypothetical protein
MSTSLRWKTLCAVALCAQYGTAYLAKTPVKVIGGVARRSLDRPRRSGYSYACLCLLDKALLKLFFMKAPTDGHSFTSLRSVAVLQHRSTSSHLHCSETLRNMHDLVHIDMTLCTST